MSAERVITLAELRKHNGKDLPETWLAIHDKVYDITTFKATHPGGDDVLDDVAGDYATQAFDDIGHSDDAQEQMRDLLVGVLAQEDRESKPQQQTGLLGKLSGFFKS